MSVTSARNCSQPASPTNPYLSGQLLISCFSKAFKVPETRGLFGFCLRLFAQLEYWVVSEQPPPKMQALSCNSGPLQSHALRLGTPKSRFIGRRQLFFDGMSSACSESQSNRTHSQDGAVSPFPISTQRFFSAFVLLHSGNTYLN